MNARARSETPTPTQVLHMHSHTDQHTYSCIQTHRLIDLSVVPLRLAGSWPCDSVTFLGQTDTSVLECIYRNLPRHPLFNAASVCPSLCLSHPLRLVLSLSQSLFGRHTQQDYEGLRDGSEWIDRDRGKQTIVEVGDGQKENKIFFWGGEGGAHQSMTQHNSCCL